MFDEATASVPPINPTGSIISERLSCALSELSEDLRAIYEDLPVRPPIAADDPNAAFALHRLLTTLDPIVAQRWHWKDTRKVMRTLRIIQEGGKLSSEIIQEQSGTDPPPRFGAALVLFTVIDFSRRYRTLFFWLYAKPEKLEPRLDARVDAMLQVALRLSTGS
jgi:tRNA dimethylallyltransferase